MKTTRIQKEIRTIMMVKQKKKFKSVMLVCIVFILGLAIGTAVNSFYFGDGISFQVWNNKSSNNNSSYVKENTPVEDENEVDKTEVRVGPVFDNNQTLPSTKVGDIYNVTISVESVLAVSLSIISGSLPQGLEFSTSGEITGEAMQVGTFNFTVFASNSDGDNTKLFSIFVDKGSPQNPNEIPVFTATTGQYARQISEQLPSGFSFANDAFYFDTVGETTITVLYNPNASLYQNQRIDTVVSVAQGVLDDSEMPWVKISVIIGSISLLIVGGIVLIVVLTKSKSDKSGKRSKKGRYTVKRYK